MSKFDYDKDFDPNNYIPNIKNSSYRNSAIDKINSKTYYSTKYKGLIVNALTGDKYDFRIGSADEKRFFTVTVQMRNDKKVCKIIRKTRKGKNARRNQHYDVFPITESVKLFYDNPEQYEMHRGAQLSQEEKDSWRNTHYDSYVVEKSSGNTKS